MNHKEITSLIKRISGQANFIGTPRIYVDIFGGDLVTAVWFNQVVYWDGKNKEPIGFYKTYKEWNEELGLSEFQVRRAAKLCEEKGLVNIMFKKSYGTPKNHYLVIWPELLKSINQVLEKLDPEETEGSETEGSEGQVSSGSKEGQVSSGSLSIEETSTKSHIDKELKDSCLSILQEYGYSVFGNTRTGWLKFIHKLNEDTVSITGDRKKIVVSGLSEKYDAQFTLAQVWQEKYAPSFANLGLDLTFTE
jgi:hypothetical protein